MAAQSNDCDTVSILLAAAKFKSVNRWIVGATFAGLRLLVMGVWNPQQSLWLRLKARKRIQANKLHSATWKLSFVKNWRDLNGGRDRD